jgi:hypothetical protein
MHLRLRRISSKILSTLLIISQFDALMLYTMGYVKNKCCKAEHRTLFAASEEVISEGNEEAYVCVCVFHGDKCGTE